MLLGRVKDCTRAFGPPDGWDEKAHGRIATLYVRDEIKPGGNQMVSAWYPKPDELQRLNAGAPVHLTVMGVNHPPVMLTVGQTPDRVRNWPELTGARMPAVAGQSEYRTVVLEFAGALSVEQFDLLRALVQGSKPE